MLVKSKTKLNENFFIVPVEKEIKMVSVRDDKRERKEIDIDMALFDSVEEYNEWVMNGKPELEYKPVEKVNGRYSWEDDVPSAIDEDKILNARDFMDMDYKSEEFVIYR